MKRFIAIALVLSLLLAACGCANANSYDEAAALVQSASYDEAIAIYTQLGDYKDSAALLSQCITERDYRAAAALYQAEDYQGAEAAFIALGEYKNSAVLAADCRSILDERAAYAAAMELFDAGKYNQAREAFLAMGGYERSAYYAAVCADRIGWEFTYRNKSYRVMPASAGFDSNGKLYVEVELSDLFVINISDEMMMTICPVGASAFMDSEELAHASYEFKSQFGTLSDTQSDVSGSATVCIFHFDTSKVPDRFTFYILMGDAEDSSIYEVDAAHFFEE